MNGMKHGSNPRRGRSRGSNGGKRHQPSRNQAHESSGPDGKVRGSAQQIYDKYLSLARDALSAGEHIAAEGFFQFAEHYYRIVNADGANNQAQNRLQQNNMHPDDMLDDQTENDDASEGDDSSESAGQPGDSGDDDHREEAVHVVAVSEAPSRPRRAPRNSTSSSKGNTDTVSAPKGGAEAGNTSVEPSESDDDGIDDDNELAASA